MTFGNQYEMIPKLYFTQHQAENLQAIYTPQMTLPAVNFLLILCHLLGCPLMQIIVRQIKYLNNIIEQDHRGIKRITNPMLGFKAFHSAEATLAGIELHHMLRKNQHVNAANQSIFSQFYALAG